MVEGGEEEERMVGGGGGWSVGERGRDVERVVLEVLVRVDITGLKNIG